VGQTPCFVFWATFPVILLTQWLSFIISSQLINECPRDERNVVLASALCLVQTERPISTLPSFTRPYISSGHWLLLPHWLALNQPHHHLGRRSYKSCPRASTLGTMVLAENPPTTFVIFKPLQFLLQSTHFCVYQKLLFVCTF